MRNGVAWRLLIALLASAGLNFALTMQNAWPTLWVRPGTGLSVELLLLLALLAIYMARRPRPGPWVRWTLTVVLFLLVLGRYAAITAHALFGREINLFFDLPHLPTVVSMTAEARAAWEVAVVGTAAVLVPLVAMAAIWCAVGAVARSLADRPARRLVLGVAALGVVAYAMTALPGLRWAARAFAHPVSPVLGQQAGFLAETLAGRGAAAPAAMPPPLDPQRLGGADVIVLFLESYGEVAYSVPEIAAAVRPYVAAAERRLVDDGWHVVSGFFTSPTFGGASWLAHSSFLTGTPVTQNRAYQLLLSSGQTSLVTRFSHAGYRTVALMPGLKLAWPEGAFYGFDRIYDAAALRYAGPAYGWWTIPDQFTLARFVQHELGTPDRPPVFAVFPTIMSHMPFDPVPRYHADWARAGHASAYQKEQRRQGNGIGDWRAARGAYRRAILYDLEVVEGFLANRAPRHAVILALGDHQPPGVVSGPDANWLVPVHVFSRDGKRIAKFLEMGFRDGFAPHGSTLGDFGALHRKFVAAVQ